MEIAIVVLGEDDVRIGVRVRNKEQNTLGIDEAAVIQERNTFQDTYDNALQRLVEFGPEITECAEKALEGNEKIVKVLLPKPCLTDHSTDYWTRLCEVM